MKKVTFQFKSGRDLYFAGDIVDMIKEELDGESVHYKLRGWLVPRGGFVINMDEVEYVKFELPEETE